MLSETKLLVILLTMCMPVIGRFVAFFIVLHALFNIG